MVELLLEHGANPAVSIGTSPLMVATIRGNLALIKTLFEAARGEVLARSSPRSPYSDTCHSTAPPPTPSLASLSKTPAPQVSL